jgi:L-lactate utilization protein LutC
MAEVDHAVVRAACGVAETGSVLLTDQGVRSVVLVPGRPEGCSASRGTDAGA